jgi:Bacterial SH3 domain
MMLYLLLKEGDSELMVWLPSRGCIEGGIFMARIVGNPGPDVWVRYPNSAPANQVVDDDIYSNRFNGGLVVTIAIILLLLLLYGTDLSWFRLNRTVAVTPVEVTVANPAASVRYVIPDSLNLRVSPSNFAPVSYVLPRGTRVVLLGDTHLERDGDPWAKVSVQTLEGPTTGWVNQRYIE